MERDYTKFPDDENGNVLWQFEQQGIAIPESLPMDFPVIFPTKEAALRFGMAVLEAGYKVSFAEYEEHDTNPWEICLHPILDTTHAAITEFENYLSESAEGYGGKTDGWGFEGG